MKKKDVGFAVIAVAILMVAGYLGYSQLVPHKSAADGVKVEVVGLIPGELDQAGMANISDEAATADFNTPQDFSGLGNKAPFGL